MDLHSQTWVSHLRLQAGSAHRRSKVNCGKRLWKDSGDGSTIIGFLEFSVDPNRFARMLWVQFVISHHQLLYLKTRSNCKFSSWVYPAARCITHSYHRDPESLSLIRKTPARDDMWCLLSCHFWFLLEGCPGWMITWWWWLMVYYPRKPTWNRSQLASIWIHLAYSRLGYIQANFTPTFTDWWFHWESVRTSTNWSYVSISLWYPLKTWLVSWRPGKGRFWPEFHK